MNNPRSKFTIQVDGSDGESGQTFYSWRENPAPKYKDGRHGRNACVPSAGGSGGHLTIFLSPSRGSMGGIHVEGIGNWEGDSWAVPAGHDLFLSACGGHGGDGGIGEDGQDGGRGRNGEDATRYTEATVWSLPFYW